MSTTTNHLDGRTVIVTGAAGGFGRLLAEKSAALGANVGACDIDVDALADLAGERIEIGTVDVADLAAMRGFADRVVDRFGAIDVMINNAGIMPLAFIADHEAAHAAWERCIDINIKGTLNGMVAAHDPMIEQGRGHVINLSSIYGNFPVIGAAVYGASKTAVNFLSESFRVETRGQIKVTIVKPTGVPATGLSASVINPAASVGILGQDTPDFMAMVEGMQAGTFPAERLDPANIDYASLAPEHIADAVIHAIDQPWGVSIGDITVRAAGDHFIL